MLQALSLGNSVRCIVIRGTGDKVFSPGNDTSNFKADRSKSEQNEAYGGGVMHDTMDAIINFPQALHCPTAPHRIM